MYYYFPNKQAVLKACFDHVVLEAMNNVALARRTGANGREKVKIVLSNFLEHLVSEISVSVAIMEDDILSPEDAADVKTKRDGVEGAIRDFVREGIEDGSIIPCDPKLASLVLLGAVNWVPRWFKSGGGWSNQQMAHAFTEMLDRMLDSEPVNSLTVEVGAKRSKVKMTS